MQDIVSSLHIFVLLHFLKCACYCCLSCKRQLKPGGKQFSGLGSEPGTEKRPLAVRALPPHMLGLRLQCQAGRRGTRLGTGHRSQASSLQTRWPLPCSEPPSSTASHSAAGGRVPTSEDSERLEQVCGRVTKDRVSIPCLGLAVSSVQRSGFRGVAKRRGLAGGRNGQASLLRVQGVNV